MQDVEKEQVIRLFKEGRRKSEIANVLGFDRSTISKFLKRFEEKESIENNQRSGRPKSMTSQDHQLFGLIKKDRRQTLHDITTDFDRVTPNPVSTRTVQRRLHSVVIFGEK